MQTVPTVNVVITYDVEAMLSFQKAGSLIAFTEFFETKEKQKKKKSKEEGSEYKPSTYIFNNSPNSNLISLSHKVMPESQDYELSLELVDPQGIFEEAFLDNSLESLKDIKTDPISDYLYAKKDELLFLKNQKQTLKKERELKRYSKNNASIQNIKKIDSSLALISDKIQKLESQIKKENTNSLTSDDVNQNEIEIINEQLKTQTSQFQRPIYITYGLGDDFRDWAPVSCYGRVLRVEYSFNGSGPRTIKLFFAGLSQHPNLLEAFSINPFGKEYNKGLLAIGKSYRIFNEEAAKTVSDEFKNINGTNLLGVGGAGADNLSSDVEKYLGNPEEPSLHLVVKSALEDFIKRATGETNVFILLPNLDYWLKPYLDECYKSAAPYFLTLPSEAEKYARKIKGFGDALEGLGLKLSEVPSKGRSHTAIGKNTFQYLEECDSVEEVENWFQDRDVRAIVQCDYIQETFLSVLNKVAKSIKDKIEKYSDSPPKVDFKNEISAETDFEILKLMHESSLIFSPSKPALVWGDQGLIDKYLYGKVLELEESKVNADPVSEGDQGSTNLSDTDILNVIKQRIGNELHPLDVLEGLNVDYINKVLETVLPSPWIGPFGPNNSGNDSSLLLGNDSNMLKKSIADLKKYNTISASRMPLFAFGTRNPNILSIDIDINSIYTAALASVGPAGLAGQGVVLGIVPEGYKDQVAEMFLNMENLDPANTDDNGIPVGFDKLVEEYYDYNWFTADGVENFDQWGEVFDALGDDNYKNMTSKRFKAGDGKKGKELFLKFMWEAFQALYSRLSPTPLQQRNYPSKDPSKKVIQNSIRLADDMANHTLTGRITTLPLYSLSTMRRAINRPCVVYCIEPQFVKSPYGTTKLKQSATWFSGVYNILGFSHTISTNDCKSEFYIARNSGNGLSFTKDSDTE